MLLRARPRARARNTLALSRSRPCELERRPYRYVRSTRAVHGSIDRAEAPCIRRHSRSATTAYPCVINYFRVPEDGFGILPWDCGQSVFLLVRLRSMTRLLPTRRSCLAFPVLIIRRTVETLSTIDLYAQCWLVFGQVQPDPNAINNPDVTTVERDDSHQTADEERNKLRAGSGTARLPRQGLTLGSDQSGFRPIGRYGNFSQTISVQGPRTIRSRESSEALNFADAIVANSWR